MGRYRFVVMVILTVMLTCGLAVPIGAQAQEGSAAQAPAETIVEAPNLSPPAQVEPLPQPTDEVMRPTRNGFRLTPEMARWGARLWIKEEMGDLDLSKEQADALTERVGRQCMRFAQAHGRNGRDLLETLIESQLAQEADMLSPERKQAFGQRLSEMVPALRQFFKDVSVDARPLLSDTQWEKWKDELADGLEELHRLESDAQRWADGQAGEDEKIDDLGNEKKRTEKGPQAERQERKKTQPVDQARRSARRDVERAVNDDSEQFLANADRFFKFSEQQTAEARQLLADYKAKKQALQTPEWRAALMQNRVKYYLRWFRPIENIQPWEHLLTTEYNALIQPWEDLRSAFKGAVIALATHEQREAALADVQKLAIEHGMTDAQIAPLLTNRFEP